MTPLSQVNPSPWENRTVRKCVVHHTALIYYSVSCKGQLDFVVLLLLPVKLQLCTHSFVICKMTVPGYVQLDFDYYCLFDHWLIDWLIERKWCLSYFHDWFITLVIFAPKDGTVACKNVNDILLDLFCGWSQRVKITLKRFCCSLDEICSFLCYFPKQKDWIPSCCLVTFKAWQLFI